MIGRRGFAQGKSVSKNEFISGFGTFGFARENARVPDSFGPATVPIRLGSSRTYGSRDAEGSREVAHTERGGTAATPMSA